MSLAVYIGRFRPFHNGHFHTVKEALKENQQVLILVGSCDNARNIKNPFTFEETKVMISACFDVEEQDRIVFEPLVDYLYDDTKWIAQVQRKVALYSADEHVTVYGNEKDHSSFYLKFFPQWKFNDVELIDDIHATDIRNMLFSKDNVVGNALMIKSMVPKEVFEFIQAFANTNKFKELIQEFDFISDYKKAWEVAPYAPTFVTVDAVVECKGHILLVKRKFAPGKGLWAIPGGFINQYEKIKDAVVRELKEETKINVSKNILRGSIQDSNVFDNPYRSLRGRTITHAFHIVLDMDYLPEIKADDDADEAVWFPIATVMGMGTLTFEDHIDIISHFTKTDRLSKL